jgi:Zn-dependent protease with chaperone function
VLIVVEFAAIFAIAFVVLDWSLVFAAPTNSLLILGIVALPTFISFGRIIAQNKLSVSDASPDRRVGAYSLADIRALTRDAERQLGVNPGSTRVFVTREKDLNASAIRLGLGRVFPSLNAIYLNRPALHVLNREELTSVIAHEIAHNERHYLVWDRYLATHLIFQLLASLFLRQLAVQSESLELLGPLVVGGVYEFLSTRYHRRFSQTLEYLCDDAGAVVVGVDAAIRGEIKIARRSEAHSKVLLHALRRKLDDGVGVSVKEALEELEEVMPFEHIDHDAVRRDLDMRFSAIERDRGVFSLKGFLVFIGVLESWDARNELREELRALEAIHQMPTIEWKPEFQDTQKLVDTILSAPSTPLFHCRGDILSDESTHPSPRQRILYLWMSRAEIEQERAARASSAPLLGLE